GYEYWIHSCHQYFHVLVYNSDIPSEASRCERNGMPSAATLEVRDLRMGFSTPAWMVVAVEDVTLSIGKGEVLAIIGESGSGKTVTAMTIARLLPMPPGRYLAGSVRMGEAELLTLSEREMEGVRGRRIGTIFQNPRASL